MSDLQERTALRVELTHWELRWAHHTGLLRDAANVDKGDAAYYDPARMQNNITASLASASCEMAVAKCLDLYWSGSAWDSSEHRKYRHLADVGGNIEVRRIREPINPLVVRRRDADKGFIIVAAYAYSPHFQRVDVIGWMEADEAWKVGIPADYDRHGTRLVDQSLIKDIRTLEVA
jgi:hypothetical protein